LAATPLHLSLHVALGHALDASVIVLLRPAPFGRIEQQDAMSRRQEIPFAGEEYSQHTVPLLAQNKAHGVGVPFFRQPTA
jgi:hypothetical protein